MISIFRKFARTPFAMPLIVLVGLGLLITRGVQTDILRTLRAPKVISAGNDGLSPIEFRPEMDRRLQQTQHEQARAITYEALLSRAPLPAILKGRAEEFGFFAWTWKTGIRPGNELVLRQIRSFTAVFDPLTNQFSEALYTSKLAEQK